MKKAKFQSPVTFLISAILIMGFVLASPIIVEILNPEGTTQNSSIEIEYNITLQIPNRSINISSSSGTLNLFTQEAYTTDLPIVAGDLSGITHNDLTDTIFGVENGDPEINEYFKNGTHKRTIALHNFLDTEGITWMRDNEFAVSQERTTDPSIYIFNITSSTTSINASTDAIKITPSITIVNNKGMEGITYDPENDCFYVATEKTSSGASPGRVYKVYRNATAIENTDIGSALSGQVTDLADIYYDRIDGHLVLLSQESEKLVHIMINGTIIDTWNGSELTAFAQPEGLAFSADNLEMFIVGEADDYGYWRSTQTNDKLLKELKFHWSGTNYTLFQNNIVAMWNFDNRSDLGENNSHIVDLSGNGNNGSLSGPDYSFSNDGKRYGSLEFIGTNTTSEVSILKTPEMVVNGTENWTVSLWVKPYATDHTDTNEIMSIFGWNRIAISDIGTLQFVINAWNGSSGKYSDQSITKTVSLGEWHHVVAMISNNTLDNCTMSMFVDGVKISEKVIPGHPKDTSGVNEFMALGARAGLGQYEFLSFNGSLDSLVIWNQSLSDEEIEQVYYTHISKFNVTNFNFYSNISLMDLINSSSEEYDSEYYLCSKNILNLESCSDKSQIKKVAEQEIISANFSNMIRNVNENFYGANTHTNYITENNTIYPYGNGTGYNYGNYTWHREKWETGGFGYTRTDMSLNNYYSGLANFGLEDWTNLSYGSVPATSHAGMRIWKVGASDSITPSVSASSDAHSGDYSANVSYVSGGSSYLFVDTNFKANKTYNLSVWLKGSGSGSLNIKRTDIWETCNSSWITLTGTWTKHYIICNWENVPSQDSKVRLNLFDGVGSGEYVLVDDIEITEDGKPFRWWRKSSPDNAISQNKYSFENNFTTLWIADYMPDWLANFSTDSCIANISDTDTADCEPYNSSLFGEIVVDWINWTSNNGTYLGAMEFQVWNEPYGHFFVDQYDYDSYSKFERYKLLYNSTYNAIKDAYPSSLVGGPSGFLPQADNFTLSFLQSDLSADFIEVHNYNSPNKLDTYYDLFYDEITTRTNHLLGNCTGENINCSRIIWGEYNVGASTGKDEISGSTIKNNSNYTHQFSMQIGSALVGALNIQNVSQMVIYQWSENLLYNDTSRYSEWPYRFAIVSEPQLDNYLSGAYYAISNFSSLCPQNSTVFTSSSTDSKLKTVTCKDDDNYNVIIINTDTEARNITLNTGDLKLKKFKNFETQELYDYNSGVTELGALDSYEIFYLTTSPNYVSFASPNVGVDPGVLEENPEESNGQENSGVCKSQGEKCVPLLGQCCGGLSCGFISGVCEAPGDTYAEEEIKETISETKSFIANLLQKIIDFFKALFGIK